jgi:hypothetical protein
MKKMFKDGVLKLCDKSLDTEQKFSKALKEFVADWKDSHTHVYNYFMKYYALKYVAHIVNYLSRTAVFPPHKWAFYAAQEYGLDEMTNNVAESQNKLIQTEFGNHHKEMDVICTKLKNRMEFWSREYSRESSSIVGRRTKSML